MLGKVRNRKGKKVRLLWNIVTLRRLHWLWQLVVTIIFTALIRVLFWLLGVEVSPGAQVPLAIALLVGNAVVVQIIVSLVMVARLGELLEALLLIESQAKQPARSVLRAFVFRDLTSLQNTLVGVLSREGCVMDVQATQFWTRTCFEAGEAPYDGTDSHVPSEFLKAYPGYLESHEINLNRTGVFGSRILIATKHDLYEDYMNNTPHFKHFWEWHERDRDGQKVSLLYIDPARAKELSIRHNLDTPDIGIWRDRFVLLFSPTEGGTNFRMALRGYEPYDSSVRFFEVLSREALPIGYPPEVFEPELANNWERFVNPSARLALEGDFLLRILHKTGPDGLPYRNVFDAATGVGVESVFLQENGFFVTPNEISEHLRTNAQKYARTKDPSIVLNFTTYDWRRLTEYRGPKYDAVLVLGNSLCLVLDREDRTKCIQGFANILRPGGLLIIDERNFSRILTLKEFILENPLANFPYKGKIMYCGTPVRGCPIHIDDNKVTFVYYADHGSVSDWDTLKRPGVIYGTLEMYPFKKDELLGLLADSDFCDIQRWSDFALEDDPDADFYTYVAVKPR